ncbi:MAG: alpha/beta hydrolase [Burkholderiaceae bacterium]|nr:alpha/beta hydrolase [Burkholderiaceae bacterium]
MNAGTRILRIPGPVGDIDCALDLPADGPPAAVAVVAHPHPLHGGTRDNKVVQTIVRALLQAGCACWRPNFRGVGDTAGTFDEGEGETEDLLAVVAHAADDESVRHLQAPTRLYLGGFSFGSFVQAQVAQRLLASGLAVGSDDDAGRGERWRLAPMILVGTAASRFQVPAVGPDAIVLHGETDDVVPLAAVMDWARPQNLPVTVLPGAGHFFHGRLTQVKSLILRNLGHAEAG